MITMDLVPHVKVQRMPVRVPSFLPSQILHGHDRKSVSICFLFQDVKSNAAWVELEISLRQIQLECFILLDFFLFLFSFFCWFICSFFLL